MKTAFGYKAKDGVRAVDKDRNEVTVIDVLFEAEALQTKKQELAAAVLREAKTFSKNYLDASERLGYEHERSRSTLEKEILSMAIEQLNDEYINAMEHFKTHPYRPESEE